MNESNESNESIEKQRQRKILLDSALLSYIFFEFQILNAKIRVPYLLLELVLHCPQLRRLSLSSWLLLLAFDNSSFLEVKMVINSEFGRCSYVGVARFIRWIVDSLGIASNGSPCFLAPLPTVANGMEVIVHDRMKSSRTQRYTCRLDLTHPLPASLTHHLQRSYVLFLSTVSTPAMGNS
jgi:hypothetical protein